jgi:hypothetical protein
MQAFPRHRGAAETPTQVMNRRRSRDQQAEIARPERPNVCIPTRVLTRPNSVSWTESADASLLAVSELSRPGHPSPARIPNVLPQHKRRTLVSAWNCLWERNVAAHCGSSSKIDTARACHVPVSERVSARWGLRLGCFSITSNKFRKWPDVPQKRNSCSIGEPCRHRLGKSSCEIVVVRCEW